MDFVNNYYFGALVLYQGSGRLERNRSVHKKEVRIRQRYSKTLDKNSVVKKLCRLHTKGNTQENTHEERRSNTSMKMFWQQEEGEV